MLRGRVALSDPKIAKLIRRLAIILTVLGINLFGDALRDAMDPRLKV